MANSAPLVNYLLVAVGGALGAVARYATVIALQSATRGNFPLGTLTVNTLGCFVAGILFVVCAERLVDGATLRAFTMTGFLGAYTTFSAFSVETLVLFAQGAAGAALTSVALNLLLSLAGCAAGIFIARAL
ncbi:MAG: fluoride efflux transporter CrcB [Gammaproteobacteria bacterium]|nr:fluoride efflux transporter CrcB [Gammaproteobacteria bacterium]